MIQRLRQLREATQSGIALIEVLVSLFVLATGIGGAIAVFPRSHQTAGTAQNLQIASALATDSIEQLRSTPWATLKDGALRHAADFPADAPVTTRVTLSSGTPTEYTPEDKPSEPVVTFADSASTQPLDYEQVTVDGRQFAVYRFASWRKESCPLVSLDDLLGGSDVTSLLTTITNMRNTVSAVGTLLTSTLTKVTTESTAIEALIGATHTGGKLATLTTRANSAFTALNTLSSTLVNLIGTTLNTATKTWITNLLARIDTIRASLASHADILVTIASRLNTLSTRLTTLDLHLASLATELTSLTSAVATASANGLISGDLIDLCQLPDDFELPDLTDLGDLTDSLATVGTTLDSLGVNGTNTLSELSSAVTTLGTAVTNLTTSTDSIDGKLSTLTTDVNTLKSTVTGLLCSLLPICVTVQNDENGITATTNLSYSATISVPDALESAATLLDTHNTLYASVIGTSATATSTGTGLKGLVDALLTAPAAGNTIRVAVAVLPVDPPDGIGPKNPVWATSIITNPKAKLL